MFAIWRRSVKKMWNRRPRRFIFLFRGLGRLKWTAEGGCPYTFDPFPPEPGIIVFVYHQTMPYRVLANIFHFAPGAFVRSQYVVKGLGLPDLAPAVQSLIYAMRRSPLYGPQNFSQAKRSPLGIV